MNWLIWIAASSAATLGFLSTIAAAADYSTNEIPKEFFGQHMHRITKTTEWPPVPFGSWRLWDAYVAWPNLNPQRGRFDFSLLDKYLDLATAHHVAVLLPLGLSPRWASSRPDEPSAYSPGNAAEPTSLGEWQNYVATVVERYGSRIKAYEIWNEPNLKRFYSGDVNTLVKLTCKAYETIKAADPSAIVVSPAATDLLAGVSWLDEFLSAGGGRCVDAIGFHFYTYAHDGPEALFPLVQAVRATVDRHGLIKLPIWNTESGWANDNARVRVARSYRVVKAEEMAAYVVRGFVLGAALGLERYFWYAWDNRDLGLIEPDTGEFKPAANAYRAAVKWLSGKRLQSCSKNNSGVWSCKVFQADGHSKPAWIVWIERGDISWLPPVEWAIQAQEDINERVSEVRPAQPVRLSIVPVLLN